MVTDLRAALHEAVDDEPTGGVDVVAALAGGRHRVRRRRVLAGAGAAATVVAGVVAVLAGSAITGPDRAVAPLPAGPPPLEVRRVVEFDSAQPAPLDVLTSTRTLWRDPVHDQDTDRFVGLTDDGLAVRTRFTADGVRTEVALVDPATGRTTRLPDPDPGVGEIRAVSLTADRLVFLVGRQHYTDAVLTFDRAAGTWSQHSVSTTDEVGRFFGWQATLGTDDRVYLAGESLALRWWSTGTTEGPLVHEAGLDGRAVAWNTDERATVDQRGEVRLERGGTTQVLAERAPRGCTPPADSSTAAPPSIGFSGSMLVVLFACTEGRQIVAFDDSGSAVATLPPRAVTDLSIGAEGVLFAVGDRQDLYLFEPSTARLRTLGRHLHEEGLHTAHGLVLWNEPGPEDSDQVLDIVYTVAALP
ncbi:hypothetical protein [Phycicoccus sonneratiae]|uniref:WD40 repeat domain-containing protein n=1 Tax=Phycicoccus sonneratiae TaxID=2807628 RepID=A0ABS2CQH6_9MICO|nr:hypothetical protein [Phycicoccus sonneraticus]MBM6402124.1 hypothetical protein [Phycicoccus sonneraticus]